MHGGTFTPGVEKARAGIYFNFIMKARSRVADGENGRVALPLALDWGAPKQVIEISAREDFTEKLGSDIDDPSVLLVREAKKGCATVLVYRVNEGEKASATLDDTSAQKATAKYGGVKGNEITIAVSTNVLEASQKDVKTYFGVNLVDIQTVKSFEDLKPNAYVDFTGTGAPKDTAGTKLTGGSNGTATNEDYMDFFAALESEYFDVAGLPMGDEESKAAFVAFIKRLRDDQGVKVRGVVAGHEADYEGITNVSNGAVLGDRKLSPAETVAWVAGRSAGATLKQSLTFVEYPGATDVFPRYDHDETIVRLRKGEFILTYNGRFREVTVESDINSFTSFSENKGDRLRKNKIVRILDAVNNDITQGLKDIIRERKENGDDIPANDDGAQITSTYIAQYMTILRDNGVIQNFDAVRDLDIKVTSAGDGFVGSIGVQPIDSAEKYYFTVNAQ